MTFHVCSKGILKAIKVRVDFNCKAHLLLMWWVVSIAKSFIIKRHKYKLCLFNRIIKSERIVYDLCRSLCCWQLLSSFKAWFLINLFIRMFQNLAELSEIKACHLQNWKLKGIHGTFIPTCSIFFKSTLCNVSKAERFKLHQSHFNCANHENMKRMLHIRMHNREWHPLKGLLEL